MRLAATLVLLPLAVAAHAQSTPAKKPVAHRTATTTTGTLPPNIPRVAGIAKPLYALRYIDTKPGTGPLAPPTVLGTSRADSKIMFYTVKYTGWLAKDGTKFDSSEDHEGKQPITFPFGVRQVIAGWDTGFDGMHIGGKRRLFIPWQLAYGANGRAPVIPAKADLIFDIELVGVTDQPPAPPAPPAAPKPAPEPAVKPSATPDPAKRPESDPADNDPAKATTPDNTPKPAPKPATPPVPPTH
jgi:peptidylprolyl isomerase